MTKGLTKEQLQNIKYVNPINHTHYSIPMGIGTIKDHMKRASECGFTGFAVTDTSVMGGVLEAYKYSRDKDFLKKLGKESFPLMMGVVLNVIDDLERKDKVNKFFNVTAFVMNIAGYRNLTKLIALSSLDDHFYDKPRVSLQELIEYNEGLVITSGNINGMIAQSIVRETGQEEVLMQIFKQTFGDRFFIEIHFHSLKMQWDKATKTYLPQPEDIQKKVNLKLIDLARRHKVPCVLVQNSYMPLKKNHILQDVLIGNHGMGRDGWKFHNTYYTMSVEEMYQYIQTEANYISDEQFVEWCANTQIIQNLTKDLKLSFAPALPLIQYEESEVNKDKQYEEKLKNLEEKVSKTCPRLASLIKVSEKDISLRTSLKIIIKNEKVDFDKVDYCERLAMELEVIQRNGIIQLCDYFLLLEDVTNHLSSIGKLRGFGRGCLTYDTLVLTETGFKKLGEVKEQDKVYTHTGDLKPVIKTFKYKVKENLVEVITQNQMNSIKMTSDHKVLGVKRSIVDNFRSDGKRRKYNKHQNNPAFDQIKNYKVGDLLFLKKPKLKKGKIISKIDLLKKFNKDEYVSYDKLSITYTDKLTKSQNKKMPRYLKVDEEFIYMIGKWIGDGWYSYNKKRRKYDVGFAFNSKDQKEIKRTVDYFNNLGFNPKIKKDNRQSLTQVTVHNKYLTLAFRDMFPLYEQTAISKDFGIFSNLPLKYIKPILLGLLSADGSVDKSFQESIASVSLPLIEKVKEYLIYLGIPSNVTVRKPHYSGKYLCKKSYKIKFVGLSQVRKEDNRNLIFNDGYFVKIKELNKVKAEPVYDLMIADTPSYTTSNFTVHNSGAGSLVAYALDITDVDPITFNLLFERFLTKERVGKINVELPGFPAKGKLLDQSDD